MKPFPSINTIIITPEVTSRTAQQDNLQELLSQLEQLVPNQTPDCHTNPDLEYSESPLTPPQVTNTYKGIKTNPLPPPSKGPPPCYQCIGQSYQ